MWNNLQADAKYRHRETCKQTLIYTGPHTAIQANEKPWRVYAGRLCCKTMLDQMQHRCVAVEGHAWRAPPVARLWWQHGL